MWKICLKNSERFLLWFSLVYAGSFRLFAVADRISKMSSSVCQVTQMIIKNTRYFLRLWFPCWRECKKVSTTSIKKCDGFWQALNFGMHSSNKFATEAKMYTMYNFSLLATVYNLHSAKWFVSMLSSFKLALLFSWIRRKSVKDSLSKYRKLKELTWNLNIQQCSVF